MKRNHLLSILVCLAAINICQANPVTESQAKRIAADFMATHAMPSSGLKMAHKALQQDITAPSAGTAAYYVFNSAQPQGGYVIVAGDDRVPAVLGYSDNGTFDAQDVPEAMQEWLEGYAEQIADLDRGAQPAPRRVLYPAIKPLVTAIWSQISPYNTLLPFIEGEHPQTGCVATAMAEIMHYWRWPVRPTRSIPAYTTQTLSIFRPELPPVNFEWDLMRPTYQTSDSTSAAAIAVATIMMYSGQSVQMDYKESSSSASTSDVPTVLSTYFGYKSNAIFKRRLNYTTDEWENIIYSELDAARPVIFSAARPSGGHAFVCDGYDGNGMFHINWGWNGKSNGYFLLNVLNPDTQGTGTAAGSNGYILRQAAVVGIEPGNELITDFEVTSKYIEVTECTTQRLNAARNFSVSLLTHFANYTNQTIDFDNGWGLYKDGTCLQILATGTVTDLDSWYYNIARETMEVGAGLSNGTYRIVPIYSKRNTNQWKPCEGSNVNYVEMVINGNNCTFTAYGASATPNYQVNNVSCTGNMHPNRPINVTVNMTNKGYTRNDAIYMLVNGSAASSGYVDTEIGTNADVQFMYTPKSAGTYQLTFSLNEDGSSPLATQTIFINPMPTANLTGSAKALNVTDAYNRIITSNNFGVEVSIYNAGSTTYDEDITIKLYKNVYGTTGTLVQSKSQRVQIEPYSYGTVVFHMENVIDGWRYFAKTFYYSNGDQLSLAGVGTHTIYLRGDSPVGDVNCDGEVSIADINSVIDIILTGKYDSFGDVNGDNEVSIADINVIIDTILNS